MTGFLRGAFLTVVVVVSLALVSGCQHRKPREKRPEALIPFTPQTAVAQLRVDGAAYPSLFSPESYALWVGPELTQQRRSESLDAGEGIDEEADAMAPQLDANFLVFECHIHSIFEDMSIAYDAVGLRGITAHLLTPGGQEVMPVQTIVGSELQETQRGALKVFGRTCLLVFSRADIGLEIPPDAKGTTIRLVISGYDSTFYFEWFPQLPENVEPSRSAVIKETAHAAKMRYNEYYHKLGAALHRFD